MIQYEYVCGYKHEYFGTGRAGRAEPVHGTAPRIEHANIRNSIAR